MRTCITFLVNSDGVAISYFQTQYSDFLKHVKNVGHKPHLYGFTSQADAEAAANALIGARLEETLAAAKAGKV